MKFTESGKDYTVTCYNDAPGGDLISGVRPSWEQCINWCSTTSGCVGIVWGPQRTVDQNCWLKSDWPTLAPNPSPQGDPLHSARLTFQCPVANGKRFTDAKRDYTVTCNNDAPGGDLISGRRPSWELCINWCSTTSGCLGVVWGPLRTYDQNCWLKNAFPALLPNPSPVQDPLHSARLPLLRPLLGIGRRQARGSKPQEIEARQVDTPQPSAAAATNITEADIANYDIVDTTNSLKLNPGKDGNLFFTVVGDTTDISNLTSGSFYADTKTKTILGDNDRILHYYPDVLASTGASRLRLAVWDKLPKGAKFITLKQVEVEGKKTMLAIDTAGNSLWPFMCGLKGQNNKLFLVTDPKTGGEALQKENMKYTVTGGAAYDCNPVALTLKT
jgi:hypothetical protein